LAARLRTVFACAFLGLCDRYRSTGVGDQKNGGQEGEKEQAHDISPWGWGGQYARSETGWRDLIDVAQQSGCPDSSIAQVALR